MNERKICIRNPSIAVEYNSCAYTVKHRVCCLVSCIIFRGQFTAHTCNNRPATNISHIVSECAHPKKRRKIQKRNQNNTSIAAPIINNNNISWYRFFIQIFCVQSFICFLFIFLALSMLHHIRLFMMEYQKFTTRMEITTKKIDAFWIHGTQKTQTNVNKPQFDHDQQHFRTIPIIILI